MKNAFDGPRFLDNHLVHAALIVLFCLISYSNTFRVPYHFDDLEHISENPVLRDLGYFADPSAARGFSTYHGLKMRYVGYFTFALNYAVHGTDVFGYHAVNLGIHLANALLIYALVLLVFRTPRMRGAPLEASSPFIALFAGLLFACHPVQTQAVTYIVQRVTSLTTAFFLLSVVSYGKARLSSPEGFPGGKGLLWYGISLCAAVLAMKTKEIAFTLPLAVVLYEVLFFRGQAGKRALCLLPLLFTLLVIPLSLVGVDKPLGEVIGDVSEVTKVDSPLSRGAYLATELRVIVTYVRLLFLPVGQNLDYDYPVFSSLWDVEVASSFLFLVALLCLGGYLLSRSRRSFPEGRLVTFGIFWFFLTLSVESSVIPIADVIFEHRLYLPSVGAFIAVVAGAFGLAEKLKGRWEGSVKVVSGVMFAVVVVLGGATYARNGVWRSEETLWQDVVRKSPNKPRGYYNLGTFHVDKKHPEKSIEYFERAISLKPKFFSAYYNRGIAMVEMGREDLAIQDFQTTIALQPKHAKAVTRLGLVYARKGQTEKAVAEYARAITINPKLAEAYNNLGLVYANQGQIERAVEEYKKAIAVNPYFPEAHNNLGVLYLGRRMLDQAIEEYSKAIGINDRSASSYNNRGIALFQKGQRMAAIEDFTRAIAVDPSDAKAYLNRGVAYGQDGELGKAASDIRMACSMGEENACRMLEKIPQIR